MTICDWAACHDQADSFTDGWWHCTAHLAVHNSMHGAPKPPPLPPEPTINDRRAIALEIMADSQWTLEELIGPSRQHELARGRQHLMARISTETGLSSIAIGRLFNRDHSTVLHAIKKSQRQTQVQP